MAFYTVASILMHMSACISFETFLFFTKSEHWQQHYQESANGNKWLHEICWVYCELLNLLFTDIWFYLFRCFSIFAENCNMAQAASNDTENAAMPESWSDPQLLLSGSLENVVFHIDRKCSDQNAWMQRLIRDFLDCIMPWVMYTFHCCFPTPQICLLAPDAAYDLNLKTNYQMATSLNPDLAVPLLWSFHLFLQDSHDKEDLNVELALLNLSFLITYSHKSLEEQI